VRILHAVTLHSTTNAFGGPVRVALNLARGLRGYGDDVRLVALGDGFDGPLPRAVEGVPARLFQARRVLPVGFSGITSPSLLARARALVRAADVVHVHLARDLVTLPLALTALRLGRPLVLQTHGMVDPSDRALARVLDTVAVRRLLRRADAVAHLTRYERAGLDAVLGTRTTPVNAVRLVNGVPAQERRPLPDGPPRVLYAARLQARKRPRDFVAALPEILRRHPDARFVMAGPDEGELAATLELARALGVAGALVYAGTLTGPGVLDELRRAHVHVLPSVDEPFPMSVLEALSVGTPSVVTESNGLAADIARTGAGRVVGGPDGIAPAVLDLLDAGAGRAASAAAWELSRTAFSMDAVVDEVRRIYAAVYRRAQA
jgi:glycosyltransferase involved in cell wall biosynthesis